MCVWRSAYARRGASMSQWLQRRAALSHDAGRWCCVCVEGDTCRACGPSPLLWLALLLLVTAPARCSNCCCCCYHIVQRHGRARDDSCFGKGWCGCDDVEMDGFIAQQFAQRHTYVHRSRQITCRSANQQKDSYGLPC